MLPLGAMWQGVCRASEIAVTASGDALCNRGYARGACGQFPSGEGPDAVRFAIANRGASIRYAIERDHHPFSHGELDAAAPAGGLLARQAEAYLSIYRERIRE